MPEEAAVAEAPVVEDSPSVPEAPASPDSPTSDSPQVPDGYVEEKRLKDTQAELTRKSELLADIEGRNGPERQAAALSEHARIELEAEEAELEPEEEFELPPDPQEEIEAIRQELAERDEVAAEAEFEQLENRYINETVAQLEESENVKLSKEERDLVVNYGLNHREEHGPEQGKPDLQGGFAALKASQEAFRKRYTESKETFVPPVGTEGEPKVNLRDKEARQKLATEAFEAAERAKET